MIRNLFHRTEAGAEIVAGGFRDGSGNYMMALDEPLRGVWLSDVPLDINEGASGDDLLSVTLDIEDDDLARFEVVEAEKPYREWCMPSEMLASASVVLLTLEQEWELEPRKVEKYREAGGDGRRFWVWKHPDGPSNPPLHVPGKWYWLPDGRRSEQAEVEPPYWNPSDTRAEAEAEARRFMEGS